MCAVFPKKLHEYGLNEELLALLFNQFLNEKSPLKWHLNGIPNIGFYQELHPFLKKWSVTHDLTKITIGRFYIAIDSNLKKRCIRADNVYRLINNISLSDQPSNTVMSYGPDEAIAKIKVMQAEAKHCTEQIENLSSECHELKGKFEKSRKELGSVRKALSDITNEKSKLEKKMQNC